MGPDQVKIEVNAGGGGPYPPPGVEIEVNMGGGGCTLLHVSKLR